MFSWQKLITGASNSRPPSRLGRANTPHFAALVTAPPTFALLAIHTNTAAVAVAAESLNDTQFIPSISRALMHDTSVLTFDPSEYPEWSWNWGVSKFVRLRPVAITESSRSLSKLAIARINALHWVILEVNRARAKIVTGLDLQESIYLLKKAQAEQLVRSDYNEDLARSVPFVTQYADFAGISLRQAADDILLKASLDEGLLAKTELLRLKYFNIIKQTTDLDAFQGILSQFFLDCSSKQLV